MKLPISLCFLVMGLLFTCAKPVTKKTETISTTTVRQELRPPSFTKKAKKDTVTYVVAFRDTVSRRTFTASFENLIQNSLSPAHDDSSNSHFVKTRLMTLGPDVAAAQQPLLKNGTEGAIVMGATPTPRLGGSVTIYTPQGSLTPPLSLLVEAPAFDKNLCAAPAPDSSKGYFVLKELSDRKITLQLTAAARNAAGKPLSAFDVVTAWNNFVKRHPAEGLALFRFVSGIDQFISGREALIMGFQVIDEKTISIRLSQPDQFACTRLSSPRLLPVTLSLGPYIVVSEKNEGVTLAPNPNFAGPLPYLHSCAVRLGKDNNPFVAFSLNKYTAMVVFSVKDLDYARHISAEKARLTVFSENRYFLAAALQPEALRRWLLHAIDRKDILTNAVKAEGNLLAAIESSDSSARVPVYDATNIQQPKSPVPIDILACSDDPISQMIGNKLLSDLSHAGFSCALKALGTDEYEKSLVKREYGLAVGCAPASVLTDQSERLRLATIWFNGEPNERARIQTVQEIPLFSVTAYLLHAKKLAVNIEDMKGMFLSE